MLERLRSNSIHPMDPSHPPHVAEDPEHPCSSSVACETGTVVSARHRPPPARKYCWGVSSIREVILMCLSALMVALIFPFSLPLIVTYVKPFETVIVFRLGRLHHRWNNGPSVTRTRHRHSRHTMKGGFCPGAGGLFLTLPFTDELKRVDMRVKYLAVPLQSAMTRDATGVDLSAIVFYRVVDALKFSTTVEELERSIQYLTASTLKRCVGETRLEELLYNFGDCLTRFHEHIHTAVNNWGIKIERLEIQNVELPEEMQRLLSAEAQATREARAKKIQADAEAISSRYLLEAAKALDESKTAVELRYLYTLRQVASGRNQTIVAPTLMADMLFTIPCFENLM